MSSSNLTSEEVKSRQNYPLHYLSSKKTYLSVIKVLVEEQCCDVNLQNEVGDTPLHVAARHGKAEICQLLLNNSADIRIANFKNETVCDIAYQYNQDVIDILLNHELNLDLQDILSGCLEQPTNAATIPGQSSSQSQLTKLINSCEIPYIGKGSFGHVYELRLKSGQSVAVKVVNSTISPTGSLRYDSPVLKEVDVHKKLSHRNIVRVFSSCVLMSDACDANANQDGKLCIFMELVKGGTLHSKIHTSPGISASETKKYMKQLLSCLVYLKSLCPPVIHRDIKPKNILVDLINDQVKLTDFGLAKPVPTLVSAKHSSKIGTKSYMAPEVCVTNSVYSYKVDVWSCGMVFYEMLTAKSLSHDGAVDEQIVKSLLQDVKSKSAEEVLKKCLKPKSRDRSDPEDLLKLKFFQNQTLDFGKRMKAVESDAIGEPWDICVCRNVKDFCILLDNNRVVHGTSGRPIPTPSIILKRSDLYGYLTVLTDVGSKIGEIKLELPVLKQQSQIKSVCAWNQDLVLVDAANSCIHRLDFSGKSLNFSSCEKFTSGISTICLLPNDRLAVADTNINEVIIMGLPNLDALETLTHDLLKAPYSIAASSIELFVSSKNAAPILRFSLQNLKLLSSSLNNYSEAFSLQVWSDSLVVADTKKACMEQLSDDLQNSLVLSKTGLFSEPKGMSALGSDVLIVSDGHSLKFIHEIAV